MARTRWVEDDPDEDEDWHAPRGPRWAPSPGHKQGEWFEQDFEVLPGPSPSMGALHQRVLANFRDLTEQLRGARAARGLTVRGLASETGVALSTVTSIEKGSVWGRYRTWVRLADGVGLRVSFNDEEDGLEAMRDLLALVDEPGESIYRNLAGETQLRVATLRDLHRTASPSMETLLAVAASFDQPWELRRPEDCIG